MKGCAPRGERPGGERSKGSALDGVARALAEPGRPLGAGVARAMGHRFAYDFSTVRVHTGSEAAASARRLDASAYTVGRHVVFGSGAYRPQTAAGRGLLAHELTHVVQQTSLHARVDRGAPLVLGDPHSSFEHAAETGAHRPGRTAPLPLARPTVQRAWFGANLLHEIAGLFAGEDFSEPDLQAYLHVLDASGTIEDFTDSDNKARAVVRAWRAHRRGFELDAKRKALLIREMATGYVGEGDEHGILDLLEGSGVDDLAYLFGSGGLTAAALAKRLGRDARQRFDLFLEDRFAGGKSALLAGHVTPLPVPRDHISAPYEQLEATAALATLSERMRRETAGIADWYERGREEERLAVRFGRRLGKDLQNLSPDQRRAAIGLIEQEQLFTADDHARSDGDRRRSIVGLEGLLDRANDELAGAKGAAAIARLRTRITELEARLYLGRRALLAQTALDAAYGREAQAYGAGEELGTHAVDAKQSAAARDALEAEVDDAPPEPQAPTAPTKAAPTKPEAAADEAPHHRHAFVAKFSAEPTSYADKLATRFPALVTQMWEQIAKGRTKAVHDDPAKTHRLADFEPLSQKAAAEVDDVFGSYRKGAPLHVDRFDAAGRLAKRGRIHDAWASEDAQGRDPHTGAAHRARVAREELAYLVVNDDAVKAINAHHFARPKFTADKPQNDEARLVAAAEQAVLALAHNRQLLFEIARAWDATAQGHDINLQLFKRPNANDERRAMWDLFVTVMHEYLHTLSHADYDAYADSLGGEGDERGSTLIEGVDSVLTEIVFVHARPHFKQSDIRMLVEPDAVTAGQPYDPNLLPTLRSERYDSYPRALKLISIVGIDNLYAAYFQGKVALIGAPKTPSTSPGHP